MITLLSTALILTSVPPAAPSDPAREEWLGLDAELGALTRSLAGGEDAGPRINGYLKFDYRSSDDLMVGGNDLGGFGLKAARLTVRQDVGETQVKAQLDGAKGTFEIKDFYARFPFLCEEVHVQAGNFKSPFLAAGTASEDKLGFFLRDSQGDIWGGREVGLQVDGAHGPIHWYLAAQNGGDTTGDELLVIGKATYAVAGNDLVAKKHTGGFGPDNDFGLTLGAALADEGTLDEGTVTAFEALSVFGPFFLHGQVLDYGDDFAAGAVTAGNAAKASGSGGTTPYTVMGQWMPNEDWGLELRHEDLDDGMDTTVLWAGVTRYVAGHATKFEINYVRTDSDAGDTDLLLGGMTVIF
jgi:hypothetical protein